MLKNVLVVDDEDDVRLFLADFLTERDFKVETASNGVEALEKFKVHTFDLVLLDVLMPEMDGLECLENIKKIAPQTIVIMITAMKDELRMKKAEKLGASKYIIKPFSLTYLEAALAEVMGE